MMADTERRLFLSQKNIGREKAAYLKSRLAKQGIAKPRGTAVDSSSLEKHVRGENVDSGAVSFTTDRDVAKRFAGKDGTIIQVPRSQVSDKILPRPDIGKYADESEVLIRGPVTGTPTRP